MIRLLAAALAVCVLWGGSARADTLDEIIDFYDPSLGAAKRAISCNVFEGHPLQPCLVQYGAQAAAQDSDFNNIMLLAQAVRDDDYPTVLARAGLGAACAWIDVPQEDVVCGDLAGAVAEAGAAAISAGASIAGEVAAALAGAAGDLYEAGACLFGDCSGGSGTTVSVDAQAAWNTCFAPRIAEGVRARMGSEQAWRRLTDISVTNGLFAEGSLQGDCSNAMLSPSPLDQLSIGPPEDPSHLAAMLQAPFAPMHQRYKEIVEAAAAEGLGEAAQDYTGLQSVWSFRAPTRASTVFWAQLPLGFFIAGERQACIQALRTDDSEALGKWASVGGDPARQAGAFSAANWPQNAPQAWCVQTYVPALQAAIAARRTPYLQSLEHGCAPVAGDRTILQCPTFGGGMQQCQTAFQGLEGDHCRMIPIALRVTPNLRAPVTQAPNAAPPGLSTAPPPPSDATQEPPPAVQPPPSLLRRATRPGRQ